MVIASFQQSPSNGDWVQVSITYLKKEKRVFVCVVATIIALFLRLVY